MNYCSHCGSTVRQKVPPMDDRPRYVCDSCQAIHYENPKLVVGCIPEWGEEILLCRRAIDPRSGFWTLPAGFLENGETILEGAIRETLEEARARVEILGLYAVLNLPHISQVYLLLRGRLVAPDFGPSPESSEVRLFSEKDIPWGEIAFQVIRETLRIYFQDRGKGRYTVHMGDLEPAGDPGRGFQAILRETVIPRP